MAREGGDVVTCCGFNIVGGLLVVLLVLIVAMAGLVGLVLLVVGSVRRHRGRSAKGVLFAAAGFGGFALGLPMLLAAVAMVRGDPRVLELDLRGVRPVSVLDQEEFPGFAGTYQLDSPKIDFELPDDRAVRTRVANTVFRAEGEQIRELTFGGPAEDRRVASVRVRRWADQLGASTDGLDLVIRPQDERWSQTTRTPSMMIEVSLQPILTLEADSGTRAIARTSVQFLDDGAP